MNFLRWHTVILNLLMLIVTPLVLSLLTTNDFIIVPYICIWTLIELVIDYKAYRPRSYRPILRFITTFAFNTLIIFGSSLILYNVEPIFNIGRGPAFILIVFILGVYVYMISKLEELIDHPLYKN